MANRPTQSSQILELARRRIPPRQIAEQLECPIRSVYATISAARRGGEAIPKFTPVPAGINKGRPVRVPGDIFEALHRQAEMRGFGSATALATAILGAVVDDQLFDAVLDEDANQSPPEVS